MAKKSIKQENNWTDATAGAFAFLYVASVIDNVHAYVTDKVLNSPAVYALVISVVLVGYSSIKNKKLSAISNETLMALVTASAIWGFGLHGWLR